MEKRKLSILITFTCLFIAFIGVIKTFEIAPSAQSEDDEGNIVSDDNSLNFSTVTNIVFNGESITVDSYNAVVDGGKLTITRSGSYILTGSLYDGQVIVDTEDEEDVLLILHNVSISCSTSAPIYVVNAKRICIVLPEDTVNNIVDGYSYLGNSKSDDPNAAIFSKSDLSIMGNGTLNVNAKWNDGIASKDGLIIEGGTISVISVDDGIRGKDYIIIENGDINLSVVGDGLKSDNDDPLKGYILIENGVINISAGGDAIQAVTNVTIIDGELDIISGAGIDGRINSYDSAKGIKASENVIINGGTFTIDSADDSIHSNNILTVNDGSFLISTGDDGIHADTEIIINGGEIKIVDSFEGIESSKITINKGDIHITSSDDGINCVGGNDRSGFNQGPSGRGFPGQDGFTSSGNYCLYVNGGYIYIDALGDGLDINGFIEMTGGTLIINGPTTNMNGAVDYDGYFKITGGYFLGVGSSGMAQGPSASSNQNFMLLKFNQAIQGGTLVHIETSDGKEVFSFVPNKAYQSIVFSSSELLKGITYDVYLGGSSKGLMKDGLYLEDMYTPGTNIGSLTLT